MEVPIQFSEYSGADYFSSPFAHSGYWDELSQLMLIEPVDDIEKDSEMGFLQIGRPGVDGIGFGYRKGCPGIWAYYPMEGEFSFLCSSVVELVEDWESGRITV